MAPHFVAAAVAAVVVSGRSGSSPRAVVGQRVSSEAPGGGRDGGGMGGVADEFSARMSSMASDRSADVSPMARAPVVP